MKTFLIILLALLAATGSSFAQKLIAVQTGEVSKFYTSLPDAVTNALDGDIIYIPGGSFEDVTISKRLHLIGVGHHPDFTIYTNYSYCNSINLAQGAHGGSISGLKICNLNIGTSVNDNIVSFSISRCWIGACQINGKSANNSFSENIIQSLGSNNTAKNNVFFNNIIGFAGDLVESTFRNNIFLSVFQLCGQTSTNYYTSSISGINNSTFENNFIQGIPSNVNYSIFNNNLFTFISPSGENVYSNNLFNQDPSFIFVNVPGYGFDYSYDYQMKSDSPGKDAGRDGTDIGIYGGIYPWKEGSIPFNPHFQQVQVSPTTDENGNLNVNIKVAAQER
jgi:hypothetical protein